MGAIIRRVLGLAITEALEQGKVAARWGRAVSGVWRWTFGRSVVRRIACPPGLRVIAIGGATLGGSGKTPLAIACALELASAGVRTTVVGHGYRGRLERAKIVSPFDSVHIVGDEALLAARALDGCARVVVAPSRAAAVGFAARDSDVLVLDGVSQTVPERANLALLAVDATQPWGRTEALPPCGDLRAPISTLLGACDAVVALADPNFPVRVPLAESRRVWPAWIESSGAWLSPARPLDSSGRFLSWDELATHRVGVVAALARPDRLVRWLVRRGVRPCAIVRAPDHGPFGPGFARACRTAAAGKVDIWVATQKCALHAAAAALGAPLAVMEHGLALHPELRARVRRVAPCLDLGRCGQ